MGNRLVLQAKVFTVDSFELTADPNVAAIFEAAFADREFGTRADIIVRDGESWNLIEAGGKVTPPNIDWSKPAVYCPLDAGFTYTFGLAKPAWAFIENRRVLVEPTEKFDRTHIPSHILGGVLR